MEINKINSFAELFCIQSVIESKARARTMTVTQFATDGKNAQELLNNDKDLKELNRKASVVTDRINSLMEDLK